MKLGGSRLIDLNCARSNSAMPNRSLCRWAPLAVALIMACGGNESPGPSPSGNDTGASADVDAGVGEDAGEPGDVGAGPCDPVLGTGCTDEASCVWLPTNDRAECRDVSAGRAIGQSCTVSAANCEEGASCVALDGAAPRCYQACRPLQSNADCASLSGDNACVELVGTSGTYGVCTPFERCDPLLDRCPAGEVCSFVQGGELGCAPSGAVPVRGDCSSDPCDQGLICVNLGGDVGSRCFEACDARAIDPVCQTPATRCAALRAQTFGICVDSTPCDPVNDACPVGQRCTIATANVTECQPVGNVARGNDCSAESCQRGNVCVNVAGSAGAVCYEPCGPMSACSVGACSPNLSGFGFGICRP